MSPSPIASQNTEDIYSDPATAQQFDESRFGGEIGRLVAAAQERVLCEFMGDLHGASALDVGCGTGRAALVLARLGASVTALDSSPEMLRVATSNAKVVGAHIEFLRGDANSLDFPDQSFDLVISLRMLMHTPDWQRCLGEMCRITRHRLVIDFPPAMSVSLLQVFSRRLARLTGKKVEAYQAISTAAIRSTLKAHGFRVTRLHRQFVLPIGLHKWIGSPRFTEKSEALLGAVGLLDIVGSPVTLLAERSPEGMSHQASSVPYNPAQ